MAIEINAQYTKFVQFAELSVADQVLSQCGVTLMAWHVRVLPVLCPFRVCVCADRLSGGKLQVK